MEKGSLWGSRSQKVKPVSLHVYDHFPEKRWKRSGEVKQVWWQNKSSKDLGHWNWHGESRIWKLSGGYPHAKFERSSQLHRLQLGKRQALQCSPIQTNKILIMTQTPRILHGCQWTKMKTKHIHHQEHSLGKWFQVASQMVEEGEERREGGKDSEEERGGRER